MLRHGLCGSLLASLLCTFAAAQERCPPAPAGKTAWFNTCRYLFVGTDVKPAWPTSTTDPEYPDSARLKKINGKVVLAVALNAQGAIDDVKVIRWLDAGLDQAAIDAVKQWKFNPATKDGEPVAVQFEVETNFRTY